MKGYESISLDPVNMKFIDSMVADSRSVALNIQQDYHCPNRLR